MLVGVPWSPDGNCSACSQGCSRKRLCVKFAPCKRAGGFSITSADLGEDSVLNCRQGGFINSGVLIILIGGLALGGLFIHSLSTGQDLPVWPAIAVILVNLVGAAKIVIDVRNAKRQRQNPAADATQVDQKK